MNPEFSRNLTQEMTPRRRIGIPLVVAFLLASAYVANDYGFGSATSSMALFIYTVLVFLWGTRLAAESVIEEVNLRTWDRQRMCRLSAWHMTWGKLMGKTAPAWVGGLMALVVHSLSIRGLLDPGDAAISLLLYLGNGMLAQMAAFAASLLAVQRRRKFGRIQLMSYQVIGFLFAAPTLYLGFSPVGVTDLMNTVTWYGVHLTLPHFLCLWVITHAIWVMAASILLMRVELQETHGPWAWIAFVVFSAIFWNGLESLPIGMFLDAAGVVPVLPDGPSVAFWVSAYAVYGLAAVELKDRVSIGRVLAHWQSRRWRSFLASVPRAWVSLPLLLAAAAYAAVYDGTSFGGSTNVFVPRYTFPVMALFVVRDLAVFHAVSLLRPDGRGEGLAILALIVSYAAVPGILSYLGLDTLVMLFEPDLERSGIGQLGIGALEAVLAVAWCVWIWRRPAADGRTPAG